jgi:hypothetical protein
MAVRKMSAILLAQVVKLFFFNLFPNVYAILVPTIFCCAIANVYAIFLMI